jgi:hypothetical protein
MRKAKRLAVLGGGLLGFLLAASPHLEAKKHAPPPPEPGPEDYLGDWVGAICVDPSAPPTYLSIQVHADQDALFLPFFAASVKQKTPTIMLRGILSGGAAGSSAEIFPAPFQWDLEGGVTELDSTILTKNGIRLTLKLHATEDKLGQTTLLGTADLTAGTDDASPSPVILMHAASPALASFADSHATICQGGGTGAQASPPAQ